MYAKELLQENDIVKLRNGLHGRVVSYHGALLIEFELPHNVKFPASIELYNDALRARGDEDLDIMVIYRSDDLKLDGYLLKSGKVNLDNVTIWRR